MIMRRILDFEPLVQEKMPTTGSKVLRALQNKETEIIDLLVRESIQNSIDASEEKIKGVAVKVEYNVKNTPIGLLSFFPELRNLEKNGLDLLEIRDSGTNGLTGAPRFTSRENSNFSKLVYDISNPQEKADAGGSWGLGKTLYYRIGSGLVIFYSRIYERSKRKFEERLAACFIEDETSNERILANIDSGIAWWGRRIDSSSQVTEAILDHDVIGEIIALLGIKRYAKHETGTSIVIPFFKKDRLIPRDGLDEENNGTSYDWFDGFEGYLDSAVQRWYCTRLNNEDFKTGPKLIVRINNKLVKNSLPIFNIIQDLYNYPTVNNDSPIKYSVESIDIRKTFLDTKSGTLTSVKVTRSQLGMDPPNNHRSPFEHLLCLREAEKNPVIFAYARKPGMIISWQDPLWIQGMTKTEKDEYIIALYIPNSDNLLRDEVASRCGCKTFEEYLRATEKSDHSFWRDLHGLDIINRIIKGITSKINKSYENVQIVIQPENQNIGLMRYLAKAFMPDDWGTDANNTPSKGSTPPNIVKTYHTMINIDRVFYPEGSMNLIIDWSLSWGKKQIEKCILSFNIVSENGSIQYKTWLNDSSLGEYPCRIAESELISKEQKVIQNRKRISVSSKYHLKAKFENVEVHDDDNSLSIVFFANELRIEDVKGRLIGAVLKGRTILNTIDPTINISLEIKTTESKVIQ